VARTRLLIALTLTGAASLAYQVCWTRIIASQTSATVTAQALVLAVVMAGLGAGAWAGAVETGVATEIPENLVQMTGIEAYR